MSLQIPTQVKFSPSGFKLADLTFKKILIFVLKPRNASLLLFKGVKEFGNCQMKVLGMVFECLILNKTNLLTFTQQRYTNSIYIRNLLRHALLLIYPQ